MDVGLVADGGDLDAGDELDAGAGARGGDRLAGRDRVVIGDAQHRDAGRRGARDELVRRAAAVGRRGVGVKIDHGRRGLRRATWHGRVGRRGRRAGAGLAGQERPVFADQQIEMGALLVGELQEDLLALGIFEPLAVALEELVRSALALDADEQRLLVVHALAQLLGALGEEAARGALEEQERRPRLELRIAGEELGIPFLERAEVLALLPRRASGTPSARAASLVRLAARV